jgi:hypothetical protein
MPGEQAHAPVMAGHSWARLALLYALPLLGLLPVLVLSACDDGGAAASGDSGVPSSPRSEVRAACDADRWLLAPHFALAYDVDYVADRIAMAPIVDEQQIDNAKTVAEVVSEHGEPCATASDRARCQAALVVPVSPSRHLLTTQGETVRLWDAASANTLFGAIDTPEEAIWWLIARDYHVACDANIEWVGDAYQIAADRAGVMCPDQDRVYATVSIDPDGVGDETSGTLTKGDGCSGRVRINRL